MLILGGGDGAILKHIATECTVDYVDESSKMTSKAQARAPQQKATFITASLEDFTPAATYDFIITPFILDCLSQEKLKEIVPRLSSHLRQNGQWIHTDFYPNSTWQKILVWVMYRFFRISTNLEASRLPNFDYVFKKTALRASQYISSKKGLIKSIIYTHISPD